MFSSYHSMATNPLPGGSSDPSGFSSLGAKRVKLDHQTAAAAGKPERKPRKTSGEKQPNPLISPTEKCKVCYEPAAKHIHYGAVTCFSCRAFFRRSIQNQSCDAYKCRKQGQCDINLKSRKSCQRCRFDKCLDVGMKSSWVLSEDERFRRFRKHREKMQQQVDGDEEHRDGGSPRGDNYYGGNRHSGEESEEDEERHRHRRRRLHNLADYSTRSSGGCDTDMEARFQYGQGSPSYLSPPPLSPLSHHHQMGLPDHHAVVAAAAAAQISLFPGMDLNAFRAAAHASGHPPFVPPPHFMAAMSQDPSLYGGLPFDASQPGTSSMARSSNGSRSADRILIPQTAGNVKQEDIADEMSEEEAVYNSDEDMPIQHQNAYLHPPRLVAAEITADELAQIKAIARIHDINYKSINFGEELIKEMVMSSVFGVPLSVSATMTAYRLMIQRVTKVAQGFDAFINLPHTTQSSLLKHNADMIVSLRGAVFFEKRKGGLDQILITMGVDDLMAARNMVMAAMKTTELKRIDYQTFNSLQKVGDTAMEARYNTLLQRVGSTVSFDPDLVKMLSYVLLFSIDFGETDKGVRRSVEGTQESMIGMMRRYIFAQYAHPVAVRLFSGLLHCIADLQELTWIKKQRQLAAPATTIANDKVMPDGSNIPSIFIQ